MPTKTPDGEFSWIERGPEKSMSEGGSLVSCTLTVKFSTTLNPVKQNNRKPIRNQYKYLNFESIQHGKMQRLPSGELNAVIISSVNDVPLLG